MGDLIDRNDAVEAIEFEKVYMTAYKNNGIGYVSEGNPLKQYNKGLDDAIKAINSLAPAQPERKIIHCKDCKFAHLTTKGEVKYCDVWFPEEKTYLSADNFCSSAEKRGE